MLLLDVTASMNAPMNRNNATPRLTVVKETVKLLVNQMGNTGLRTITFAGGLSSDMGERYWAFVQGFELIYGLRNDCPKHIPAKVVQHQLWYVGVFPLLLKYLKKNTEGNTRIMPGWTMMQKAFNDQFISVAPDRRPVGKDGRDFFVF